MFERKIVSEILERLREPRKRIQVVGGQGLPLEEFFRHPAIDFL